MEKNFFKFCNALLSTLWIGRGPLYEQTWIPVTQECFLPSLVKLAQWFWRRFSFGKGRRTSFEQTRFPFIFFFFALCQIWLKLVQLFRRRWKCEKFTDGRMDKFRVNSRIFRVYSQKICVYSRKFRIYLCKFRVNLRRFRVITRRI